MFRYCDRLPDPLSSNMIYDLIVLVVKQGMSSQQVKSLKYVCMSTRELHAIQVDRFETDVFHL